MRQRIRSREHEIARALETEPSLLPVLPYLLQDLDELGGMSHHLFSLLRNLRLPLEPEVLDLGCGKGAIACALALEFGWRVRGVDFFAPFVVDARARAERLGVNHLCRFECEDACAVLEQEMAVDVLVLFSVGKLHRTLRDTVGALRRVVRPGGLIAFEEAVLAPGVRGPVPCYEESQTEEATIRELCGYGDRMVGSRHCDHAEVEAWNRMACASIERRARELAPLHPELEHKLQTYVDWQYQACHVIDTSLICAVWLLERV